MSNQVMEQEKRSMTYSVNGEEIKLSPAIVTKYLKRGNKDLTDQEITMFMMLCKTQRLNPFLNEAYVVKFGQDANIIVGKGAFMRRAETNKCYEGFEAGLIVLRNNEVIHTEGNFKLKDDVLLGAWAKVYRSDRKYPTISQVPFDEYTTGKSTWLQKPTTMIRKVAIVQAMREAFPSDLNGMYTSEEIDTDENLEVVDDAVSEVKKEVETNANQQQAQPNFSRQADVVEAEVVTEPVQATMDIPLEDAEDMPDVFK